MTINIQAIKEEFVIRLRNNIPDPGNEHNGYMKRSISKTEIFTGDGIETTFELLNDKINNRHTLRNIISLKVNDILKIIYLDYTVKYDEGKIIFITPPLLGQIIEINYVCGETWIYPDFPRVDISLKSYPRISVDVIAITSKINTIGADHLISDILANITIF